MTTTMTETRDNLCSVVDQRRTGIGLALMRLTIGTMFVWVFFENLGKGLYTARSYANLIHNYIENGSAPEAWKSVMAFAAAHASMAAPLQAVTEISLGVLLVLGLFIRPVALVAFAYLSSLWISEWGTAWIWELLVPVMVPLALAVGAAGRTWGAGCFLVAQAAIFSVVVANGGKVRVSVIVPTRNEAEAIGRVLADLPMNLVNEVIVIDNCSSDGTPEIAADLGARVISETRRG